MCIASLWLHQNANKASVITNIGVDMSVNINLEELVAAARDDLKPNDDENYNSIVIFILVGKENEVVETELNLKEMYQDYFACRSARIVFSDFRDEKE